MPTKAFSMGRWRPRPLLALALLFRLGTWVADLDRTLVGEPAVVVLVIRSTCRLRVIEITPHDYRRMAELLTTYSSLRLQAADACVIALAERLDLHEVTCP